MSELRLSAVVLLASVITQKRPYKIGSKPAI